MPHAIEMSFGPVSEEKVRDIWRELARRGVSSYMRDCGARPHISLAVFDELDPEDAERKLSAFAAEVSPFPVLLSNLGVFSGDLSVLFLGPVVSAELIGAHRKVHELFARDRPSEWEHYLEEKWIPHCTLALDLSREMVPRAVESCMAVHLPIEATVTEIGLIEFRPVKELFSFNLRSEE